LTKKLISAKVLIIFEIAPQPQSLKEVKVPKEKGSKSKKAQPRLRIENSCFAGLEIALKKKRNTIGRNVENDICLDEGLVSDQHAQIVRTTKGFRISDLNSGSGLKVNGKKVQSADLKSGNVIEIGSFRLKFIG
jgi:pSer/pThr/pTyr-binding forkhead associated (FHA) protein